MERLDALVAVHLLLYPGNHVVEVSLASFVEPLFVDLRKLSVSFIVDLDGVEIGQSEVARVFFVSLDSLFPLLVNVHLSSVVHKEHKRVEDVVELIEQLFWVLGHLVERKS